MPRINIPQGFPHGELFRLLVDDACELARVHMRETVWDATLLVTTSQASLWSLVASAFSYRTSGLRGVMPLISRLGNVVMPQRLKACASCRFLNVVQHTPKNVDCEHS